MTWNVNITNVGGIRSGSATIEPGVNAIQASNWQGKTSLITALRAVLGGKIDSTAVTSGESSGSVTLVEAVDTNSDPREFTVEIERRSGGIRKGDPYVSDPEDQVCADLFSFLDGRNEIRAAVRDGVDLTPLLTRPFDQMNLDERIRDLKAERRELERELGQAERAAKRLPDTQQELTQTEAELDELREELSQIDGDNQEAGQEDALREELRRKQQTHEQLRQSVTRLQSQIDAIREDLSDKRDELEDIDIRDMPDLNSELEDARTQLSSIEAEINTLEELYNVNRKILDQNQLDLVSMVDRQVDADQLGCWVCGGETTREAVETQIEELSDQISTRRESAANLSTEVEELEARKDEVRRERQRKEQLQSEIATLETRLEERRAELEDNEERLDTIAADVEDLEDRVEETDDRRKTLEQKIARKEATRERLDNKISELEQDAQRRDQLEERIEELSQEIDSLRTRRERTIDRAREAFEAGLDDILEAFGPSFQAARLDKHTDPATGRTEQIELVIARDGREISVDELSEGETELVGFMTALAGYEAFDVADRVPCMLIDDVGGLASEHLHTLVEYLNARAGYVVTSAYPEAGTFDGQKLSPETWDIVADSLESTA